MICGDFELRLIARDRRLNELMEWPAGIALVEERQNAKFSIEITNRTPVRVLAAVTVDGLSTYTGQAQGLKPPGYVLPAGMQVRVTGWRLDDRRQLPFEFASEAIARTARSAGLDAEIGLIRVAFFGEKQLSYRDALKELGHDLAGCREWLAGGKSAEQWVLANADQRLWIWLQLQRVGRPEAAWLVGICKRIGCCMRPDPVAAVALFRDAARRGFPWALLSLGDCYSLGVGSLMADQAMARRWYANAARLGVAEAEQRLANTDAYVLPPAASFSRMYSARFVRASTEPDVVATYRCEVGKKQRGEGQ